MRRFLLISIAALSIAGTIGARNITFNDLYSVPSYGDIQISPDGRHILYVLMTRDTATGESASHIWIMDNNGENKRQVTNGPTSEWHPRWYPDGRRIFYISDRETETDQVWQMGAAGTESRQVSNLSTGISGFEFFSDGARLLIETRVYPDCHDDDCNVKRKGEIEADSIEARAYDKLLYRHYNHWADGKVNRLLIYNFDSGTYNEIYSGPQNVPTDLLGGGRDYDISPDGVEICFVMYTDSTPAIWPNNDLFVVSAASEEPVRITGNKGLDTSPQYSPDGKYLAYLAMAREGYESDQQDLVLYNRDDKSHTNFTGGFDRSVGDYQWSADSRGIYFSAIEHGFSKIWHLDIGTGEIEMLSGSGVYGEFDVTPDESYMAVTNSLSDKPYEIYRKGLKTVGWLQLTDEAEKVVSDLNMRRADEFWFEGFNGDSVHGFLTMPPDFDSTAKYPMVLLIHGGPQWCWLGDFNYYGWNTQLTAAQGYVVAQIDPHGSVGYGLKFKEYVSGNWGRGEYEDLMMGVDYLIGTYPFIDSTRMAALGRSYGGFMTNWICGHTDRFNCLITVDGTYDHISEYGATEELWFPEWEYKGTPWTNREEYVRSSPETYADNFKTPTMVIHGGKDYRVDLSQGLEMFTALQRMGVPSRLVHFPDEGHSIGKLKNLRYVYKEQFEWLRQWLEPQGYRGSR